jgi:3-deoxy-D-manno-octulosonic-acid transferase
MTTLHSSTTRALFFYRLLWFVLAPLLRFHKRMKIGYQERILKKNPAKADLWIQAASVGEAYIVEEGHYDRIHNVELLSVKRILT